MPDLMGKVQLLQAAIKYEQDDLMNTKAFIEGCPPEEAETSINHACVMYKEALQPGAEPAMFEKARLRFQEAMNQTGFQVSRGEGHRRRGHREGRRRGGPQGWPQERGTTGPSAEGHSRGGAKAGHPGGRPCGHLAHGSTHYDHHHDSGHTSSP